MTPRRLLSAVLLAVATLSACEVSVPFGPAEAPPPVALSGAFSPDSLWRVRLIGSTAYGGSVPVPYLPAVTDATVTILDVTTGERLVFEAARNGTYRFAGTPAAGHRYEITAARPDGSTLRASGESPPPPESDVTSIEAAGRDVIADQPVGVYRVTLRLGGARAGESLVVEALRTDGAPDADLFPVFLSSDDPDLRDSFADDGPVRVYTEFSGRAVFLGPILSGRTVVLVVRVPLVDEAPSVRLRLTALSPDLRRHLATLDLQADRGGDPFTEPVRVFSNVDGGAGVFAGYVARDTTLTLPFLPAR